MTSGVCQQQSCFHQQKNGNKDLLQDFTGSKYLQFNMMCCSGKWETVRVVKLLQSSLCSVFLSYVCSLQTFRLLMFGR